MKKLILTIIPFYVFTAAFGQIIGRVTSVQTDTLYVKVIVVNDKMIFNGYMINRITNLFPKPGEKIDNNTLFTLSGIDWLMSNHSFELQLRSDLDKVIADAAKLRADNNDLKTENAALKAQVIENRSNILEHETELSRLQNDSTTMYIINSGTIAKPIWKITTVKPK